MCTDTTRPYMCEPSWLSPSAGVIDRQSLMTTTSGGPRGYDGAKNARGNAFGDKPFTRAILAATGKQARPRPQFGLNAAFAVAAGTALPTALMFGIRKIG